MIDTKALREKVLDLAIRGKLVPQDPNDEPASVLLERIRAEKEQMVKDGKLKAKDIKNDTIIFKGDDNLHYEQFPDGTVKCIEDEIPFDVPAGWAWCRLNALSAAQLNAFVDGPFGSNLKTEHYTTNREVRIIQLNNIGDFIWRNTGIKYTTFEHAESLDRCKTYPNDIVIAKMMPAGRAIIVPSVESIYVISSDCVRLRVADSINNKYIMFAINSPVVNAQVQYSVHGIGRSRTSLSKCKELLIPIPPVREQILICESIETVFSLLITVETSREELSIAINSLKSKILDLAIHGELIPQNPDDEPTSVLLERIRAEKEELIKQGKIKRDKKESVIFKGEDNSYYEKIGETVVCIDSELPFEIPNNWTWCRLQSICEPITDGTHQTPIYSNNGYVFLSAKNVTTGSIDWENVMYIPESLHQELYSRIAPRKGDILLAKNGTIGVAAIVDRDCEFDIYVTLALIRTVKHLVSPHYLLKAIGSTTIQNFFKGSLIGIGVPNLHLIHIRQALIPIPPREEQERLSNATKEIFDILSNIEHSLS